MPQDILFYKAILSQEKVLEIKAFIQFSGIFGNFIRTGIVWSEISIISKRSSVPPCILCHPVFHVTLYSGPPYMLCHPVFRVTLYSMLPCTPCYPVLCVTLYSTSSCIPCCPVFCVALYSVSLCTLCCPVFHVVLFSVSPYVPCCPVFHVTLYSGSPCIMLCCQFVVPPDSLVSTVYCPVSFSWVHLGWEPLPLVCPTPCPWPPGAVWK